MLVQNIEASMSESPEKKQACYKDECYHETGEDQPGFSLIICHF
jgi:hypothetical protein